MLRRNESRIARLERAADRPAGDGGPLAMPDTSALTDAERQELRQLIDRVNASDRPPNACAGEGYRSGFDDLLTDELDRLNDLYAKCEVMT